MYRIVHCKEYDSYREIRSEWWVVQCQKKKWWTFGNLLWFTEQQELGDMCGGSFEVDLKFKSEKDAFEYIGRILKKIPKNQVVEEPVCSYI
jgi:hypothetical protein